MFRRMADRFSKAVSDPVTHELPDPVIADIPGYMPRGMSRSWLGLSGKRNAGANQLREWFPGLGKMVSTRDGKSV